MELLAYLIYPAALPAGVWGLMLGNRLSREKLSWKTQAWLGGLNLVWLVLAVPVLAWLLNREIDEKTCLIQIPDYLPLYVKMLICGLFLQAILLPSLFLNGLILRQSLKKLWLPWLLFYWAMGLTLCGLILLLDYCGSAAPLRHHLTGIVI